MKKELTIPFPSGKDYEIIGDGTQALTVSDSQLRHYWKYTCEQQKDEDDSSLGHERKSYEGEHRLSHKFYAGTELCYNAFHDKWQLRIRFCGLEPIIIMLNKRQEGVQLRAMVEEWDEFNSKKP